QKSKRELVQIQLSLPKQRTAGRLTPPCGSLIIPRSAPILVTSAATIARIASIALVALSGIWLSSARGQSVGHGISAANINVVQNDTNNNTTSVTVSTTLSI